MLWTRSGLFFYLFCSVNLPIATSTTDTRPAKRDNVFGVTSPAAGDTITLPEYSFDDAIIQINWTVADALRERPLILSLVQGPPHNLTTIETISSNATNNGTYTWYASLSYDAVSACNYSIYIKAWTDYTYSGYFTIINPDDEGIDVDSTCPAENGHISPDESNYEAGQSTDQNSPQASSSGPSSGGNGENDSSATVTTTTLAIAVVIPIVVLLVIFGLVLFFGVRRGWFIRKADRNILRSAGSRWDNPGDQNVSYEKTTGKAELDGRHEPQRLDGTEVYQLQGDEERRV